MTDQERAAQEALAWAWYELNAGPRTSVRTVEEPAQPEMAEAA